MTPEIPGVIAAIVVAGNIGIAIAVSSVIARALRRVLAAIPLSTLNALQVWRVIGIVFVILLAQGRLPAHFALPAGWGDFVVGVTAPLVALALARAARGATALAIGWNLFGLLDLVVAVGMGTGLLAPLLVPELGPRVPPAAAMGVLPMMLVPVFAVPMSVMMHVLALVRLIRRAHGSPRLVPAESH
jgi:hypothetical protein